MKTERKCAVGKNFRAEYPVSREEDGELFDAFSHRLVSLIEAASEDGARRTLTYSARDGAFTFRLSTSKGGKVDARRLYVLWRDGFIVKYEKL